MNPNGDHNPIGERLQDLRASRQWNQTQLAKKARCGITTISEIERGAKVGGPLIQERIARAFGIPRDVIFPRDEVRAFKARDKAEASA